MRWNITLLRTILIFFAAPCGIALAGNGDITVTLRGGQDNTLYETDAGNLSNGMGQHLFVGRTGSDGGDRLRRALIKFPLGVIAPSATVQSVEFTMMVNREPMNGGAPPAVANLHRVSADWGEGASDAPGSEGIGTIAQPGDATWLHTFFDTDFWGNDGGDFSAASSASAVLDDPGALTFASTPQMVADVQNWISSPSQNFGWIILGSEGGTFNARRISSSQNPNQAEWPSITIVYTPGVAPPTSIPTLGWTALLLLGLSLVLLGAMTIRRRLAS